MHLRGEGGLMLFHTFWVIHTVNELDSNAKNVWNKVSKNDLDMWRSISLPNTQFLSIKSLHDLMKGGILYMGTSSGRARPHTHWRLGCIDQSESASMSIILVHSAALHRTFSVYFWLWGKDNLVQLPTEPSVTWTVDAIYFSGAATEFCKCVCWFPSFRPLVFYKQCPVQCWICTSFDTDSIPSDKGSRTWFETAGSKWNGIKFLCFVGNQRSRACDFSSAHGMLPGAQLFSERIVKDLSFINIIKLKSFWRY